MRNKSKIFFLVIIIFFLSLIVHYYPVWQKGCQYDIFVENLVLAKNLKLSGIYSFENDKNIVLNSDLVKDKGVLATTGNKLTPIIYQYIFKYFGFHPNWPFYISLLIFSLVNVLLFFIVLKIFDLQIACLFSLVNIFIPVIARGSAIGGYYEWAILFFSIGLICYFYPKKENRSNNQWLQFILASVFWGCAIMARNAFLLSFIPFIIFDSWQHKNIKRGIALIVPIFILFSIFIAPDYLNGNSIYSPRPKITYNGHLFPDPYTYYYSKDEYLNSLKNPDVDQIAFLLKYKQKVSIVQQVESYISSAFFYIKQIFRLVTLGGVLILLLLGIGWHCLKKKNYFLMKLFSLWFGFLFFSLIFLRTSNWNHFLEISFPICVLIALGIYQLLGYIQKLDLSEKWKLFWSAILILSLTLHFIEANRWSFHEIYATTKTEELINLANKINNNVNLIEKNDVIAVGIDQQAPLLLNYYTDKNYIYFDPQTVKKLLFQNKLVWAFEQFGVTKYTGFDKDLSMEISKQFKQDPFVIIGD